MEQSVVIRHVSGTKGPAVEQIPIAGRKELIAGRAPSCDIRYDLAGDDLVSRRHMKIEISGMGEPEFMVVDLNSRNGTFVNKRRIKERSKLRPGDVVQLGAGGPEFVFDLDPPNNETTPTEKTTAYNAVSELTPPKTDSAQPSLPPGLVVGTRPPKRGLKWRRSLISIAVLLLLASAVILLVRGSRQRLHVPKAVKSGWTALAAEAATMSRTAIDHSGDFFHKLRTWLQRPTPNKISVQNKNPGGSLTDVVNVNCLANLEVGWMLLDARSGRQLRQVYIENSKADKGGGTSLLVPNAGRSLPLFVLLNNNRLQPVLTLSDNVSYRPIGGIYRNPGVLASADGLILTSRRIAAPWAAPYEWPSDTAAGVVAKFDKRLKLVNTGAIARRQFPQWLPQESQFILADSLNAPSLHLINSQVRLDGRTDYLTASLGSESRRVSARVVRASDRFDLAVIRMDTYPFPGQQPQAARLLVTSDQKPGDSAVLLRPANTSLPNSGAKSVSEWNGKVVALRHDRDAAADAPNSRGDRYELAIGPEPAPEPGAPVFDALGRVFAVETAADPMYPARMFAIPIRYGVDMLPASRN